MFGHNYHLIVRLEINPYTAMSAMLALWTNNYIAFADFAITFRAPVGFSEPLFPSTHLGFSNKGNWLE